MNLEKLYVSKELREKKIVVDGEEIPIKVRDITWMRKQKILNDNFTFGKDGEMKFNMAGYKRAMLLEMIADAPWGKTDAVFLEQINSEVGDQLDKIVPEAFSKETTTDFFAKG